MLRGGIVTQNWVPLEYGFRGANYLFVHEYDDGTELRLYGFHAARIRRLTDKSDEFTKNLSDCGLLLEEVEEMCNFPSALMLSSVHWQGPTLGDDFGLYAFFLADDRITNSPRSFLLMRLDFCPLKISLVMVLPPNFEASDDTIHSRLQVSLDGSWIAGLRNEPFGCRRIWRARLKEPFLGNVVELPLVVSLTPNPIDISLQDDYRVIHVEPDGLVWFASRTSFDPLVTQVPREEASNTFSYTQYNFTGASPLAILKWPGNRNHFEPVFSLETGLKRWELVGVFDHILVILRDIYGGSSVCWFDLRDPNVRISRDGVHVPIKRTSLRFRVSQRSDRSSRDLLTLITLIRPGHLSYRDDACGITHQKIAFSQFECGSLRWNEDCTRAWIIWIPPHPHTICRLNLRVFWPQESLLHRVAEHLANQDIFSNQPREEPQKQKLPSIDLLSALPGELRELVILFAK